METVVQIEGGTFGHPGREPVVRGLNWTWRTGETWAVTGGMGSGKSKFLELLRGRIRLLEGTIRWPILESLADGRGAVPLPEQAVAKVSFKEESRSFSHANHYYQQRYDFADDPDVPTLEAFLRKDCPASEAEFEGACATWHIDGLLSLTLLKLSNGQMRRARLAKAVLRKPAVLLLDEPGIGLDAQSRTELDSSLLKLVERGQRLLITAKPDGVPAWVSNVLPIGSPSQAEPPIGSETPPSSAPAIGEAIIECRNVRVTYGDKAILDDVSWTVRRGERWALLGPNGSGKTTLLSLLCGDHPQAYSNSISLFGRPRGSGETIWDIRRRIGFVSPELHVAFNEPLTGFQAAGTGFHDVLVRRPLEAEQEGQLHRLFETFQMEDLKPRYFKRLSTGEQRMVLLLRALVKEPELLILDEPFQGLDSPRIARLKDYLENRLRPEQALIFVSHLPAEIPANVNRVLRLKEGRVEAVSISAQ